MKPKTKDKLPFSPLRTHKGLNYEILDKTRTMILGSKMFKDLVKKERRKFRMLRDHGYDSRERRKPWMNERPCDECKNPIGCRFAKYCKDCFIEKVKRMSKEGLSMNGIARLLQSNADTVRKYRKEKTK